MQGLAPCILGWTLRLLLQTNKLPLKKRVSFAMAQPQQHTVGVSS